VHQGLYRFIKLAKPKAKFTAFKTNENEVKTHKIVAMLFCFAFPMFTVAMSETDR